MTKVRVSTCSLAGCFGCHMSFLDVDERLVDLLERVEFNRSPLTDIKACESCDIGFIEGGLCNQENVEVLLQFRKQCRYLVAVGACAINGGIPAMRNSIPISDCLEEVYLNGKGLANQLIPNDPELPRLLNQVRPIHEAVKIDYFLPGCPPSADEILNMLQQIVDGNEPSTSHKNIRFD
ncbi:MAG: NADP oxidoreductase [Motiliproteus sp.]|nr:NADP oxidoreductase [Motiliproteus sp.]